jgi:hypothetical protein
MFHVKHCVGLSSKRPWSTSAHGMGRSCRLQHASQIRRPLQWPLGEALWRRTGIHSRTLAAWKRERGGCDVNGRAGRRGAAGDSSAAGVM